MAASPDGDTAYVCLGNGTVQVVDTVTNTVTTTITVGNAQNSITVSPDGNYAYVTNAGSDTVSVIRL